MSRIATIVLAVVGLGVLPATAVAQVKKSDAVVAIKATADKIDADGKQTVTIEIAIDKAYHLYANPVGQPLLFNAQTQVKVTSKTALKAVGVNYPEGTLQKDVVV